MITARIARPAAALIALAGLACPALAQCPPAAPTGLTASDGAFCGSVFLNWNDVSGANTYNVYRNTTNSYSSSSFIGSALFGNSQLTDLTASTGQTYYYWVTATRTLCLPGSGISGPSAVNSGYRGQEPPAPFGVAASDDDYCNAIRVTWVTPNPGLGGAPARFRIYRNTINLYLTSSDVGTAFASAREFIDNSANPETTYYYWVRAENECGTAASDSDEGSYVITNAIPNDSCSAATLMWNGGTNTSTLCAIQDGQSSCGNSNTSPDIWYKYLPNSDGILEVKTCDYAWGLDTVLSVHTGCPGNVQNEIGCNDDYCSLALSRVEVPVLGSNVYYIRVASYNGTAGTGGSLFFQLRFTPSVNPCYANCDGSTTAPVLNVGDFTCFLQRFAAAEPYANCDQSTTAPLLNVGDFTCFLQRFAAGCP
jgi:hypothetical protein